MSMKKTVRITLDWRWLTVAIIVVALGVGGYAMANKKTTVLPEDIQQTITFSPLAISPTAKKFSATSYHLSKAEDGTQVLSYIITTDTNKQVTVSEYSQPPQFNDIPDYKQQFLTNVAQQYDSVQSSNGTVYLGRQAKNNNRQLGLMIEKGLLIFLNPDKDLDKPEWRRLGDQLELQKISN
jgi:hypothetical protein